MSLFSKAVIKVFISRQIHYWYENESRTRLAVYEFFAKMMGVGLRSAQWKLRHHVQLTAKPVMVIKETYKTLQHFNCSEDLVLKNMEVLSLSAAVVRQRHAALSELGFAVIEAPEILSFPGIVIQSREALWSVGLLRPGHDPVEHLFESVGAPAHVRDILQGKYQSWDCVPLQAVRLDLMSAFIAQTLEFGTESIETMFEACVQLQLSSVSYVNRSAVILRDELCMREQLRMHPELLCIPPDDLVDLFKAASSFGLDICRMAVDAPQRLCTDPALFRQTCQFLMDYGVPPCACLQCPAIFGVPPDGVFRGLRALCIWPDFKDVRRSPQFLKLLMVPELANRRLRYLEWDGVVDCGLGHLLTKDEVFVQLLAGTAQERAAQVEQVVAYIADALQCPYEEAFASVCDHPGVNEASMATVRATLGYLLGKGYPGRVILRGLPLVLHPWQDVDNVLEDLPNNELAQPFSEWQGHDGVLQLVLYLLEKAKSESAPWDHPPIEDQAVTDTPGLS